MPHAPAGVAAALLTAIQGLACSRLADPGRENWRLALATIEGPLRRLLRPRSPGPAAGAAQGR